MSTSQLRSWLQSHIQSDWDTKVAEWLKRTQGRALQEQSKQQSANSSFTSATAATHSSGGDQVRKLTAADSRALNKLKDDVNELENYIPWNAVVNSWGNRRTQWARRLKECPDVTAVAKQLVALEAALLDVAMVDEWRADDNSKEWAEEVTNERSASKLRTLLREMEESIKWSAFVDLNEMSERLTKLLATPGGALLKEQHVSTAAPSGSGEILNWKSIQGNIDAFKYSGMGELVAACKTLARHTTDEKACLAAIRDHLIVEQEEESSNGGGGGGGGVGRSGGGKKREKAVGAGGGDNSSDRSGALKVDQSAGGGTLSPHWNAGSSKLVEELGGDLSEDVRKAGAKRSRIESKEAKYEQFKRQQRLHPEYAGVYAEAFLEKPQKMVSGCQPEPCYARLPHAGSTHTAVRCSWLPPLLPHPHFSLEIGPPLLHRTPPPPIHSTTTWSFVSTASAAPMKPSPASYTLSHTRQSATCASFFRCLPIRSSTLPFSRCLGFPLPLPSSPLPRALPRCPRCSALAALLRASAQPLSQSFLIHCIADGAWFRM